MLYAFRNVIRAFIPPSDLYRRAREHVSKTARSAQAATTSDGGIALATAGIALTVSGEAIMWNLFNCYLSGRHDFGVWCETGTIFLRCVHCGKRSVGWTVHGKSPVPLSRTAPGAVTVRAPTAGPRVLPFDRAAAAR
jgi:hypothetical protein